TRRRTTASTRPSGRGRPPDVGASRVPAARPLGRPRRASDHPAAMPLRYPFPPRGGPMKRSLPAALAVVLLTAGCRTAGPKAAPSGGPGRDPLRPYVGDVRVLRSKADERNVSVGANQRLSGECDMAVRVRSAGFNKNGALFALETIGRPAVGGREPRCR